MIVWDDAMATGDRQIDTQHRHVLQLVERLSIEQGAPNAPYEVLSEIMDFAQVHFATEENLMASVGYPEEPTREMIAQHAEFTDYSRLRVLEFRTGEVACIGQLQDFLSQWLVHHEFGLDRKLVAWMRSHHKMVAEEAAL